MQIANELWTQVVFGKKNKNVMGFDYILYFIKKEFKHFAEASKGLWPLRHNLAPATVD